MQPLTDATRPGVTAGQVRQIIVNEPSIQLRGGLEIVDINLTVVEDISDDLAGGNVERSSYATMHGSGRFRITRRLDWGGDLIRPYLIMSGGGLSARFNLGVYHPTTPDWPLEENPPTYEVEGYDILLRLNQPVGDAFSIAAGQPYLATVEEILIARGYTAYVIDQTAAGTLSPSTRAWIFDEQTTWLSIVNDLLGSIGYAGVWSDWDGRLRIEQYQSPIERGHEWIYTDDPETTLLGPDRSVGYDYFSAPNRWVIYQSNVIEGATPVEGNGIYTYINESRGDTSVQARRGLVITKTVGVDVADHASLIVRAQEIIDADMTIPTYYDVNLPSPNPLHWHFDRMILQDQSTVPIADVLCTQWSMPLPPDQGDMTQQWRVLVR